MGTITVNVKDDIEKEFRKLVRSVHGAKKGDLGKALSELPPPIRTAASRCIGFYLKNVERVLCSCFCSD